MLSNIPLPLFHTCTTICLSYFQLRHALYYVDQTITFVLHSVASLISSRSRPINQRILGAIRETVWAFVRE